MEFKFNDGGRSQAGFKGKTGDCVVRAIAIAANLPYQKVYDDINIQCKSLRNQRGSGSRTGVPRKIYESYLTSLGFKWVPTMKIGSGCKVHLIKEELPSRVLIVALSKHLTVVIDGVIHDTYDPQRGKTYYYGNTVTHISPERCVYGYYTKQV